MKQSHHFLAVLFLAGTGFVCFTGASPNGGPQASAEKTESDVSDADLKLEARIAKLEESVRRLQGDATATKLIGEWNAHKPSLATVAFPKLKFKDRGRCRVIWKTDSWLNAHYSVDGTTLRVEYKDKEQDTALTGVYSIDEVTANDFTISWEHDQQVRTATYSRVD